MKPPRWLLLLLLLLIVAIGIAVMLRPRQEMTPAAQAKAASTGENVPRLAGAESKDPKRSPAAEPIKPRPLQEIRDSLRSQARAVVEKSLGGADAADKQALMQDIRDLEAKGASGLGLPHPVMLLSLAAFSRRLDLLGDYDESVWRTEASGFLKERLSEVEALDDGESPAALRERWWREMARDDAPEAILLRHFDRIETKETLCDELQKWMQLLGEEKK